MTDKQKEAIERLKYINMAYDCNNYYSRYDLDCIETVLDLIQTQQTEIEKKDKIIDEMAIAIGYEPLPTEEYCIFRNFDCPEVGGNRDCKECVKQYFERKVENGN